MEKTSFVLSLNRWLLKPALRVLGDATARRMLVWLLVVSAGEMAPAVKALPVSAQIVYKATFVVGMGCAIWNLFYGATSEAISAAASGDWSFHKTSAALLNRFFESLIFLWVGMAAVQIFGTELTLFLAQVQENPERSLALFASCLVVLVAFTLIPSQAVCVSSRGVGMSYATGAMWARPRLPADIYRTSIHEAGHLLLYSALPELPADLLVSVKADLISTDQYRGQVTHQEISPEVWTESSLSWAMLMHLAGAEAEFVVLGEKGDGSREDNRKWQTAVTTFLDSGFGEVFYISPVADDRLAHNRVVLNDMKAKHVGELREFLGANKTLLVELAEEIADKKILDRSQTEHYLARVVGQNKKELGGNYHV